MCVCVYEYKIKVKKIESLEEECVCVISCLVCKRNRMESKEFGRGNVLFVITTVQDS